AQGDVEDKPGPPKGRTFWPTAVVSRKESAARRRREKAQLTLDELKKEGRVHVKVQPVSVFLLRNGTVISIFSRDCVNFAEPIMARLQEPDTGVRMSADASLLVQSLLDLVVDSAFDVVDAFHEKVLELEHDVLLKPNIKAISRHTFDLSLLSGDLALHKRTMEPLKMVIYGLRRYDEDRCAALAEPGDRELPVQGFMSHKAKIYLVEADETYAYLCAGREQADVHDHVEYILSTMDTFAGMAENLINYTFNVGSHPTCHINTYLSRRLTMATIIFLPLTLLTGYFSMNFEAMWSVDLHTDLFFWEIAIPVMTVIISLFLWPDFKRMSHYVQKRLVERRKRKLIKRKLAGNCREVISGGVFFEEDRLGRDEWATGHSYTSYSTLSAVV
ncbi:hypothetical protein PISMIDRAFT_648208, partial [Pisolithus microcarpus 441]